MPWIWLALIVLAAGGMLVLNVVRRGTSLDDLGAVSDQWISHHRSQ